MGVTVLERREIQRDLVLGMTACFVAVLGATNRGTAVPRTGTGSRHSTGSSPTGSGSFARDDFSFL